jgi:hypothetical protein
MDTLNVYKIIEKYGNNFEELVWKNAPYSNFGHIESIFLWSLIRKNKYKNVVEVGSTSSGRSTFIGDFPAIPAKDEYIKYDCAGSYWSVI